MARTTLIRSFIAGLGMVVLVTACGGDNIAGPGGQRGNTPIASPSVGDTTATDSLTAAALAQAVLEGPSAPAAPNTPNTPAADSTPSTPPVDSTPSTPPVDSTPSTPPVDSTPSTPPVDSTPEADTTPQLAVTRKLPLEESITVSRVIGPKGGQIKIGMAGLTVVFSKGAVLQNTTITVTADAGSLVSYQFGPHGTFLAPVAIEQDMHKTTFDDKADQAATLYGGYLANGTSDITGDSAKVSEFHAAKTTEEIDSFGKRKLKDAVYIVWHFSGYILISARR